MANLGYEINPALKNGAQRQIAGYGGNDEYANTPSPSDVPPPSVADSVAGGVSDLLGFGSGGRSVGTAILGGLESVGETILPYTPAGVMYRDAKTIAKESVKPNTLAAKTARKMVDSNATLGAMAKLGDKASDYAKQFSSDLPTLEEVNLGRKPGIQYDDQVAPFVPARTDAEVSASIPAKPSTMDEYPEEGIASPFAPQNTSQTAKAAAPVEAAGVGQMGPAFGSGGVTTGISPMQSAQAAQDDVTDADIAEFNKLNAPKVKEETAAKKPETKIEGLLSKPTEQAAPSAGPERLTRDKLLKMAGENIQANDQARAERVGNDMRRRELRNEWNAAARQAASGNLSERELGLRRQAELEREGLDRGFLQQEAGAQTAYKKFMNNPYNIEQINRIRQEEGIQAQQQAAFAKQEQERKDKEEARKLEERKLADADKKEQTRKEERQQDREDKLNKELQDRIEKLADVKDEREYNAKRDELQSELKINEFAKKFKAITARGDREQAASLQYQMHNQVQQDAANAVAKGIEEANKYTGIGGRIRAWIDGKEANREIERAVDSAERHLRDNQAKLKAVGDIYGIKTEPIPFDRARIMDAIRRRGPENSDDLMQIFRDLGSAGEAAIKYGTPAGRAGTAFGWAVDSVRGTPAAPMMPQGFTPVGGGLGPMAPFLMQ